ncbi:MAG: AAA family ATPase, partial [Lachnospiraceae bacterium]
MKIIHTADWHIGPFKGPEKNGVNLRSLDTKNCLASMIERVNIEKPELVLVPGDIFHTGKTWSDRCCDDVITALEVIEQLADVSGHVVIMQGTKNHDGDGQFKVLQMHFASWKNVSIVVSPEIVKTEVADIAVLPGFDRGVYRSKFPGLSKEEENEVFTHELANIVMGFRAQCESDRPAILMAHYTVPGCNLESGQTQILTQFEPVLSQESLRAANYDLVALGHIHRPQLVSGVENVYYSGAINAFNFNDEGQKRGFWIHHFEDGAFGQDGMIFTDSEFIKTPYREFVTFHFTDTDITAINQGNIDEVAMNWWRWNGAVAGKIVRILYECSAENHKAFKASVMEKAVYEDGAFYVLGISPERVDPSTDRMDLSQQTDPEENLRVYLNEKQLESERITRLIEKARPIVSQAMAMDTAAAFSGVFVPIEIEVQNYRAYAEEKFSFEDIQFCTINGSNGAGKSSLFMDAIIDCIYEEPREGSLKGSNKRPSWLRNVEGVRSGYISFTFAIGEKIYRIYRNRTKSGSITLNLSELLNGEWLNRSQEKSNNTQADIEKLIGVDSLTFKSCALIMQDQYGLFLQAKKEDRMVVLGNLLGLGLYGEMEKLAKDKAAEVNRLVNAKKDSIEVHTDNILAAGRPAEELELADQKQQELDQKLTTHNQEKETASLQLNIKNAARERHLKLLDSISILESKKRATEEIRAAQNEIIANCDKVLLEESEVLSQGRRYRELLEKEKQLIEGATLYNTKTTEASTVAGELTTVKKELDG